MGAEAEGGETAVQRRRVLDREEWDAYWKIRKLDSDGTIYPKIRYIVHKAFDAPVTWFREKVVEPLHDRNALPYYHRKLSRVPEIDECGVNDRACFFEANEQFRLDKLTDGFILQYGELGSEANVTDAYMKQKHRLIWERRHPEILEARAQALAEHKEKLANGDIDYSFWKKGMFFQDKKSVEPNYEFQLSKSTIEGDKPLSKDWEYYKKVAQDPEFDKEQGKTSNFSIF